MTIKELTIINGSGNTVTEADISNFEYQQSIKIPEVLKIFFLKYGGCRIKEMYFHYNGKLAQVCDILMIKQTDNDASVEEIYMGHLFYGVMGFIPFATDSGGWDYNVSINPETYGQVWVDKFDSGEENPFEFVCNSFEEFIDGLTEEE